MARGSGEHYSSPSGSGQSPATKRIFSAIHSPKFTTLLKVSPACTSCPYISWECCSKKFYCLISKCPNFQCNGKIIFIFLRGTWGSPELCPPCPPHCYSTELVTCWHHWRCLQLTQSWCSAAQNEWYCRRLRGSAAKIRSSGLHTLSSAACAFSSASYSWLFTSELDSGKHFTYLCSCLLHFCFTFSAVGACVCSQIFFKVWAFDTEFWLEIRV